MKLKFLDEILTVQQKNEILGHLFGYAYHNKDHFVPHRETGYDIFAKTFSPLTESSILYDEELIEMSKEDEEEYSTLRQILEQYEKQCRRYGAIEKEAEIRNAFALVNSFTKQE